MTDKQRILVLELQLHSANDLISVWCSIANAKTAEVERLREELAAVRELQWADWEKV
jgi:hypothetical protein